MPRIPRRSENGEERTELASGDPLATPTPAPQSASTSGDPLTQVTPPESTEKSDLSEAPPVTPANTAAPSEADVAPGDASSAKATEDAAPGDQPTLATAPVDPATAVHQAPGQPTADDGEVSAQPGEQAPVDARPRFRQRTRMRRRLRYLRRLRELAFRDLGGLVFDLHRFGRERNDLVTAKLEALANIDRELRTLQDALGERRDFMDLREAGIAACPRCGTLHDTDANYCPGCGTTLRSVLVREAFPVTVTPAEDGQTEQPAQQQSTPAS